MNIMLINCEGEEILAVRASRSFKKKFENKKPPEGLVEVVFENGITFVVWQTKTRINVQRQKNTPLHLIGD